MRGRINYGFDKRRKELERKQKQDEKRQRKLEAKAREAQDISPPDQTPDGPGRPAAE